MFARFVLWLLGWKVYGEKPTEPKYVYLAFPHSSNWDGALLLLFMIAIPLDLKWMGKSSLMKPPLGWFLKALGGVGINRSTSNNMVDQMATRFRESETFALGIPPEGTRGLREHWKSGFYHIALKADVPICCGVLDYKRKEGGFGPMVKLTGNMAEDMAKIRKIYAEIDPRGHTHSKVGPIALRKESEEEKLSA
jgi:1-acyl-sn-glycerol-3-phosphate acyltransferase